MNTVGMIELKVRQDGRTELQYTFRTLEEASEMLKFLSGFWPRAQFVVQPLPH